MTNIFLCVTLFAACFLASAAQKPITGAFGFTLGGQFDESRKVSTIGPGILVVKPLKPFRTFGVYTVGQVPGSKKIFMISATSSLSPSEAESELKICLAALEKVYGPFRKTDDGYIYEAGGRSIKLLTGPQGDRAALMLSYEDKQLGTQYEREARELVKTIPGAFGLKFGEPLPQSAIIREVEKNWYQIAPPQVTPGFQYGAEVTPKSRKIFSLTGIRQGTSVSDAENFRQWLSTFYGAPRTSEKEAGAVRYQWQVKEVTLMLSQTQGVMYVLFRHDALAKVAEAEKKALELETSDTSAL